MANPLITSASEVDSRVEPATKFFDPAASVGIMERYGMSGQSRAFAEDALKSANQIDAAVNYDPQNRRNDLETHEWNRKVQGRADVEYGRKKEQEDAFGAFAKEVYQLDFDNDPDAEKKLGAMASNPLLAGYEPARAILNHRFGEVEVRRKAADQDNDYEKRLADELGSNGFTVVRGDDGKIDRTKTFGQVREDKLGVAKDKAEKEFRAEQTNVVGKERVHYLDMDYAQLDSEIKSGVTNLAKSATAQGIELKVANAEAAQTLLNSDPAMPKEAFVAQVLDLDKKIPDFSGLDRDMQYVALSKAVAELPASQKTLVGLAEGVWSAHHLKRFKKPADPKAPTKNADGTPASPQQGLESPDNDVVLGKIQ